MDCQVGGFGWRKTKHSFLEEYSMAVLQPKITYKVKLSGGHEGDP